MTTDTETRLRSIERATCTFHSIAARMLADAQNARAETRATIDRLLAEYGETVQSRAKLAEINRAREALR